MGIKAALFWFGVIFFLVVTWQLFDLPSDSELKVMVTQWIADYGLLILFFGSFLEALLLIGFYFPGSVLIFVGVGLAPSATFAFFAVLTVSAGMLVGYACNYFIGRYGWYKLLMKLGMKQGIENAQTKMEKNDVRYISYTFWHPGLAAFTATAAGILQIGIKRFLVLAFIAVACWNTLWGVLVYNLGDLALTLVEFSTVFIMISIWVVFELCMMILRKRKQKLDFIQH